MSEHKVTENITQAGTYISGEIVCSCGKSASITHNKKTSLTVARARLREMHENLHKPKSGSKIVLHKEKKSKKRKPVIESTENNPEIDEPELPEPWGNEPKEE